ncbi:hypothetical protein [uncultured Faecalibaculum sp.]|uniref:hypothetical protein n=2 Tax=uncultured Faecalibaculum sp. TaxID=1729681 RepID=UPI0025EA77FF|nr:hypothetical protein [uncultured Faecalibaculum sp.]
MNKPIAYLAAALLSVTLAACSQPAPAADTKDSSTDKTVQETTPAAKNDAASAGEKLADAFRDKGYQITDIETETDEYSFDAANDLGKLEISVETGEAQKDYNEATASYTSENFFEENNWSSDDSHQMTSYLNTMNTIYNLAAVDTRANVFYEVEDIAEANLDQVVSVMESIGF